MLSKKSYSDPLLRRIRALVEPLCATHRVDLVDVVWGSEAGHRVLRITIERVAAPQTGTQTGAQQTPTGWGVTLDDCAELSRETSQALDLEDTVPFAYTLEVSSPGLERELTSGEDFRRFAGLLAKAKLSRPAPDGQRLLRGTIVSVDGGPGEETLTMHVDKKHLSVPLAVVTQANLVYEAVPMARKGLRAAGAAKPASGSSPRAVDKSARGKKHSGRKANVRSES